MLQVKITHTAVYVVLHLHVIRMNNNPEEKFMNKLRDSWPKAIDIVAKTANIKVKTLCPSFNEWHLLCFPRGSVDG